MCVTPFGQVVHRASFEDAKRFLEVIQPALRALTGSGGIVCREERHGDPLYDVIAPVPGEVACAIYRLIRERGMGREDVTEAEIVAYLEEQSGSKTITVGPLADGRGIGLAVGRSGDEQGQLRPSVLAYGLAEGTAPDRDLHLL